LMREADAQECRANADQCMDLAAKGDYPEMRATFVDLSDRWTKLAIELEKQRKPKRRPAAKER